MITIYKTNSMKNAAAFVMNSLKSVDPSNLSVMRTVIVPDRASLEAERALLEAVGGSFNVQVRTFRRLANEILPKYNYLSKQAGIMALTGIIQDNRDKLVCFTKGVETAGFVSDMYDTISMMKYCKISPEKLLRDDLPKGVAGKAHDVAVLYQAYLDYSENKFIDSADKLDLLCESLPTSKLVTEGYFYLYDFDNFSKQELALVEQLAKCSLGVTVACCSSDKPQDRYLYLHDDIFHGVTETLAQAKIDYQVVEEEHYEKHTEQIGKNLFRYATVKPQEVQDDFLEIYRGTTRVQEVYALACRVQKHIRNGGRFSDIYAVTSDVRKYSNAIAMVFDEFDIPYFCDSQFALQDHPYARFVLDFLAIHRNKAKLNYVLPFVKNHLYCCVDSPDGGQNEDVFHFENYCLKYNVSYDYGKMTLGRDKEAYFENAANFGKQFDKLFKSVVFPTAATADEYVGLVRKLVEKCNLNERNATYAQQQQAKGLTFESKVTVQAQQKFEETLYQAETVLGHRPMKLDEFLKMLTVAVASVKISVIPVANDCVVFANMAKARKHDIKFLALLGANFGAMPIVKKDAHLLTDKNLQDLTTAGINAEPQIFVENKRERFSLFQLLQEPTQKLYVSYAQTDGTETLMPSPFIDELQRLYCKGGKPVVPTDTADENVYTKKQALAKVILNNRKVVDNQRVHMPAYEVLSKMFADEAAKYKFARKDEKVTVANGSKLYFGDSQISVTRLTDFYNCPYKHYFEYGLYIRPRTVAELKSADLGNILHNVLEVYVREEMDVNESSKETVKKAQKCFDNAISDDYYKGIAKNVALNGTLRMLRQEAVRMCEVVKQYFTKSLFTCKNTEIGFGGNSTLPPVEVDFGTGKFYLKGKIDRVDHKDKKFIVVDYKSGATAAQFSEKDLYAGHKLQLFVYMKAVIDDFEGYTPVGFYYFNMHDKFSDSDGEAYKYNGYTIADKDVIGELDTDFVANGKSTRLGVRVTKEGEFYSSRVITPEQLDGEIEYSFRMIKRAGELMSKGFSNITPYKGVCDYCDFKDVCDFNDTLVRNERDVKDDVTAQAILDMVKK